MKSIGPTIVGATIVASLNAAFGWYGGKVFIGLAALGVCTCLAMAGVWSKRRYDEFQAIKKRLGRVERKLREKA